MTRQTLPVVYRFTRSERLVHRCVAVLVLTCVGTAAILYNGSLAVPIGHRHLVELVHVWSGLALPVPLALGLLSKAYRADLGRLNRFSPSDWRWLRARDRRDRGGIGAGVGVGVGVGKFNAGQKLNAALSGGSMLVLFGTGILMYFPALTRLVWRTGATFVHDWFALGFGLLVLGHLFRAARDPLARRGMRTGWVPLSWARREHGDWAAELEVAEGDTPAEPG